VYTSQKFRGDRNIYAERVRSKGGKKPQGNGPGTEGKAHEDIRTMTVTQGQGVGTRKAIKRKGGKLLVHDHPVYVRTRGLNKARGRNGIHGILRGGRRRGGNKRGKTRDTVGHNKGEKSRGRNRINKTPGRRR